MLKIKYVVACFFIAIYLKGCSYSNLEDKIEIDYARIKLRWVKNYPNESKKEVITGLYWALSILGAKLPVSDAHEIVKWKNNQIFELNLNSAGFSTPALNAFIQLNKELMQSEEYRVNNAIDLGRFIALTINSSNHYYKITGVPTTLNSLKSTISGNYKISKIHSSGVSFYDRLIEISEADTYDNILYLATEGEGSFSDDSFTVKEYETLDIMENGQPRFGIFDLDGNLKLWASNDLTAAGKPAKCMWCHESGIQPIFSNTTFYTSGITAQEFLDIRGDYNQVIEEQRTLIDGLLDYTAKQDHVNMELIYISFQEPSARRLALEWQMAEIDVMELLNKEDVHANDEFSFLGSTLYNRDKIEKYSPYKFIATPSKMREASVYEPDLIH